MPKIIIMEVDPAEHGFMTGEGNTFSWGGNPRTFGVTLSAGWPDGTTTYHAQNGAPPNNPTTTYAENDFGNASMVNNPIEISASEPLYQFQVEGQQGTFYMQAVNAALNWWSVGDDEASCAAMIEIPDGSTVNLIRQGATVIIDAGKFVRTATDPQSP